MSGERHRTWTRCPRCVRASASAEAGTPFAADYAVRLAADLIAHTWDPVALMALRVGRRRRIDLLSGIAGVSYKVLTQTLRRL
ncbi:winged helix-turn-helix transcriptional regulator [Streptomyces paromomycinus]|uniref:winged helix-turn-helix transcriptional regulator n=1 Tax=Streptomyces paromomycinus TaxID=92743 RepID=UPI0027D93910|nr:winged helix-turn-helix transcriptional regulator [Streptomyces paromomycinus]